MDKMRKCPFCGGEARAIVIRVAEDAEQTYVECKDCFAKTEGIEGAYSDFPNATLEWNTRPLEDELLAALEYVLPAIDEEWGECGCVGSSPDCPNPSPCYNCVIRAAIAHAKGES